MGSGSLFKAQQIRRGRISNTSAQERIISFHIISRCNAHDFESKSEYWQWRGVSNTEVQLASNSMCCIFRAKIPESRNRTRAMLRDSKICFGKVVAVHMSFEIIFPP